MDMHETARFLVDTTTLLTQLNEYAAPEPETSFNILSILRDEADEVNLHSRLLFEILDPNGSHGMGDAFLKSFFKLVLDEKYMKGTQVSREVSITSSDDLYGRVDLLIENGSHYCYPIEVKIYAGDQPHQIARYAEYAERKGGQSCVYYLTLDEHNPEQQSLEVETTGDAVGPSEVSWKPISFQNDIRRWLDDCCSIAWNVPVLVETFKQYRQLIDKLTNDRRDDFLMDQLRTLVSKSQENFNSALLLADAVIDAKEAMMARVLNDIHEHLQGSIEEQGLSECLKLESRNFDEDACRFYRRFAPKAGGQSRPSRNWPGMTATLPLATERLGDLTLAFRIEIDYRLFFGLVFWQGDWRQVPQRIHDLSSAFPDESWKRFIDEMVPRDSWWVWWRYLPSCNTNDSNDETLDFVGCTGRYQSLYNEEDYKSIMSKVYRALDQNLKSIVETGRLGLSPDS